MVVKIVFRFVGLIMLVIGGGLTYFTYDFMDNALPVQGQVMSVEVNSSDDGLTYRPTIRFVDFQGRKQTGITFLSSSNYDFRIGSNVDILYDTRDPQTLRMDTWIATWGIGLIILLGSIVPFFISGVIGRTTAKPKRSRRAKEPEEEMIEVFGRTKGLFALESRSDHDRESNYTPTVRRRR
jgi:hypothetical protein